MKYMMFVGHGRYPAMWLYKMRGNTLYEIQVTAEEANTPIGALAFIDADVNQDSFTGFVTAYDSDDWSQRFFELKPSERLVDECPELFI